MRTIHKQLVILVTLVSLILPIEAKAESFSELTAKGATVSKMTENQAGLVGWIVSGNGKRYFCKLNVSIAIVDAKSLISILSLRRMIRLDRAAYEKRVGGPSKSMPKLVDLKNGRLRPSDVGECTSTGK